jgi:hypothetical protein
MPALAIAISQELCTDYSVQLQNADQLISLENVAFDKLSIPIEHY